MKSLSNIILLTLALSVSVFAQTGSQSTDEKIDKYELVHFGDLIDVDVIGSSEYDWRGKLTPEGFINAPLYDSRPVYGLCRTPEDIGRDVAKALVKFLRSPDVRIRILDKSDRPLASITGAVMSPQRFRIRRQVKLSELLVLSGGFQSDASSEIEIIRNGSASCDVEDKSSPRERETKRIKVQVNDLLKGKPDANKEILYGDFIQIKRAPVVYVIGAVSKPGRVKYIDGLTATRAIKSSGGTDSKDENIKFAIFRRNAKGTDVIEGVFDQQNEDGQTGIQLLEYDIVEVFGESKKASQIPPVAERAEAPSVSIENLPVRNID